MVERDAAVEAAVSDAIERAGLSLSGPERVAVDELITAGSETLAHGDERRDKLANTLDEAADELVRGLLRHREASKSDRGLSENWEVDSVRQWVCPLYPFC